MSPKEGKAGPEDSSGGSWAGALSARLTHDTALYVSGAFVGFILALVNVAVITRFLSPEEFGQLALLLVFAALLTVVYNLATLQGTFMAVFGAAGDEDVEDVEDEVAAKDKRKALGTGLVLTLLTTVVGTAVIVPLAPSIADILIGDRSEGDLVLIAAGSAAAGALWRLGSNVLRLERRPYAFVALSAVRPLLVIGAVIPLVASGHGVGGAIAGTAIGSAASVLVMLVVIRPSFLLALEREDASMIVRRGAIFVPIIASFWIAQNVDLFALSRYASDEQVGLYRLAGRIGAFVSYFSAALFMAWTPLARTSVFVAAERERGRDVIGGSLLTYFVIGGMILVLGMTVAADGLVRIAPPEYEDAAPLIPLLAAGFLAHGLLVAVYRVSRFPGKRGAYIAAAITSAVVFLGLALVLIPWLGASGAALSVIAGFLTGALGMAWLSQRGAKPLRIEYGRVAASLALAGLCLALARGAGSLAGDWQPAVEVLAFALYLVLLAVTGVVPRDERQAIARVAREALRVPKPSVRVQDGLRLLSPEQRSGLLLAAADGWSLEELAASRGTDLKATSAELVRAVRRVAELEESTDHDAAIGEYLFSQGPVAERDALGRGLWSAGADPAELHVLERTLEELRRLPSEAWDEAMRD